VYKIKEKPKLIKGSVRGPETKLLFIKDRLLILRWGTLQQILFYLAYNTLEYFSFDKCYEILWEAISDLKYTGT